MLHYQRNKNEFEQIYPEEIGRVRSLMDDNGVIGMSDIIVESTQAKIVRGPLKDYKGAIHKINKRRRRAKIELSINGKVHLLDVGINVLEQLDQVTNETESEKLAIFTFIR